LFFNPREDFLLQLPKGGTVAEIGVASGDFSDQILDRSSPEKLHLIDPWIYQKDDDYQKDPNNLQNVQAQDIFLSVQDRFKEQIERDQIQIHRAFSADVADQFPDAYFDWLYIDGMHTCDAVLEDLRAYWPKLKPDGFLLGHDYANHKISRHMEFGVVEAVNRFVDEIGCDFTALNVEPYPTYVLSKDPDSERHAVFIANIVRHLGLATEIKNVTKKNYYQNIAECSDGFVRIFPVFE